LYCFTIIDSAAEGKFLAEWKSFISQLIGEQACGCRSCLPSQPLVAILLPLCSVGYVAKLWISIVELKQFLCSLPGITSCGGVAYGFF